MGVAALMAKKTLIDGMTATLFIIAIYKKRFTSFPTKVDCKLGILIRCVYSAGTL